MPAATKSDKPPSIGADSGFGGVPSSCADTNVGISITINMARIDTSIFLCCIFIRVTNYELLIIGLLPYSFTIFWVPICLLPLSNCTV